MTDPCPHPYSSIKPARSAEHTASAPDSGHSRLWQTSPPPYDAVTHMPQPCRQAWESPPFPKDPSVSGVKQQASPCSFFPSERPVPHLQVPATTAGPLPSDLLERELTLAGMKSSQQVREGPGCIPPSFLDRNAS